MAADVDDPQLTAMLEAFDALPIVRGPDDRTFALQDVSVLAEVRSGWLSRSPAWEDQGLWPADARPAELLRQEFASFFRDQYEQIVAGEPLAAAERRP